MKSPFFLSVLIFITSSACKKSFLDVPITKEVVAEEYVTDLTRAEEFLNGIYILVARDLGSASNILYSDISADNTKVTGSTFFSYYSWAQSLEGGDTNNRNAFWRTAYNGIRSCNFLLERIDQFRIENPTKCDAIKGQLYALRALFHDNLIKIFAQPYSFTTDGSHPGIPYDTIYSQSQQLTRQPVREVYALIVKDLTKSISLIPASLSGIMTGNFTTATWLNRNAAKALLARAYLFMGDFAQAGQWSREVTEAVPLMVSSDYPAKLYTSADKESLFWAPPIQPTGVTVLFQGFYYANTSFCVATTDLVNIVKERPSDRRNGWFKPDASGKFQVMKFPQGSISGVSESKTAYYQTFIRASEMYLTAAECYANQGKEDSARFFLDKIRSRADNLAGITTASGPALLDSIYKERRKELCFENLRLYDLLRLRQGINRKDVASPAPSQLPFPSNKAVAPIPLLDAGTYSLEQNPGYN